MEFVLCGPAMGFENIQFTYELQQKIGCTGCGATEIKVTLFDIFSIVANNQLLAHKRLLFNSGKFDSDGKYFLFSKLYSVCGQLPVH